MGWLTVVELCGPLWPSNAEIGCRLNRHNYIHQKSLSELVKLGLFQPDRVHSDHSYSCFQENSSAQATGTTNTPHSIFLRHTRRHGVVCREQPNWDSKFSKSLLLRESPKRQLQPAPPSLRPQLGSSGRCTTEARPREAPGFPAERLPRRDD